jgi:hypothetical protein
VSWAQAGASVAGEACDELERAALTGKCAIRTDGRPEESITEKGIPNPTIFLRKLYVPKGIKAFSIISLVENVKQKHI